MQSKTSTDFTLVWPLHLDGFCFVTFPVLFRMARLNSIRFFVLLSSLLQVVFHVSDCVDHSFACLASNFRSQYQCLLLPRLAVNFHSKETRVSHFYFCQRSSDYEHKSLDSPPWRVISRISFHSGSKQPPVVRSPFHLEIPFLTKLWRFWCSLIYIRYFALGRLHFFFRLDSLWFALHSFANPSSSLDGSSFSYLLHSKLQLLWATIFSNNVKN